MNEDQLRDRLAAVDVPPSRLEMDALVRAGRRRAFRRRTAQATGSTALVAGVLLAVPLIVHRTESPPVVQADATPTASSAPAAAIARPGRCRMTKLPVPPGMTDATAVAVDPTGRYIVGNDTVKQDFRPILWTNGRPQALPVPGKSVQANAVNASGVVVGLVEDGRQEYVFRYENGAYTRLRTPPGSWRVYPYPSINAAGDVVINAEPSANIEGKDSIILLWKAGTTTAVRLPVPIEASAHDITDDGTIVGAMYKNGAATTPYVWDQQGRGHALKVPAGQVGALYAARGEWATGGLWPSTIPGLWNLETGELTIPIKDEGKLKKEPGPGTAINASGWVVVDGSLLRDGAAFELEVPRGQTSRAQDVSDAGLVVGQAMTFSRDDNENEGPRLWRC